jgi:hypothetical protein
MLLLQPHPLLPLVQPGTLFSTSVVTTARSTLHKRSHDQTMYTSTGNSLQMQTDKPEGC